MLKTVEQVARTGRETFQNIPYPGRFLGYAIIWDREGKLKLAAIYALTGRSKGRGKTANRYLISSADGRIVEARFAIPTNDLIKNPELYQYRAMSADTSGFSFLSNGDHMMDLESGSGRIGTDLANQSYEPDNDNTPRIAAIATLRSVLPVTVKKGTLPFLQFALVKKAADSTQKATIITEYGDLSVGTGRFIHTYDMPDPDENQLQPFNRPEPHLIEIDGNDAKSVAFDVWNMLAPPEGLDDLRISVAVQVFQIGHTHDYQHRPELHIYNRFSTQDPGEDVNDRLIENPPFVLN